MTPNTLSAHGRALFGPRWQCELARALGVADRTVRRWVAGAYPIPDGVAAGLRRLVAARQKQLARMMEETP